MPKPMTVDVLVVMPCYGGNGGVATQIPDLTLWWGKTLQEMTADPRVGRVSTLKIAETPITMSRNKACKIAKEQGYDMVLMVDSDNEPDYLLGKDPHAKSFWRTSFDFAYERLTRNIPTCIFAPYCGPHPNAADAESESCVYVFHWHTTDNSPDARLKLTMYSRAHANQMAGIQPAAAGPTGVILYTMSALDLIGHPKFAYEWTDETQSDKASTEDVYNTREISLAGHCSVGEDVVWCNWDSWAAHWKPVSVGKPAVVACDTVSKHLAKAVLENRSSQEKLIYRNLPPRKKLIAEDKFERTLFDHLEAAHEERNGRAESATPPTHVETEQRARTVRKIGDAEVRSLGFQTPEADLNALRDLVKQVAATRAERRLLALEVGSWVGESAVAITQGFGKSSGVLTCVDTWEGSKFDNLPAIIAKAGGQQEVIERFKENVGQRLGKTVQVIHGESVAVADSLPQQRLDFVFIDGGHHYDQVKGDINAWGRHIRPDGMMCGHDYGHPDHPGVKQAVDEFFGPYAVVIPGTTLWTVDFRQWLPALTSAETAKQ